MTKVYLIRHAEAEGNLHRRMHGQYNSLVTVNGYRQIQALEERFKDVQIDAVYSSDLFRTMTTARAIYVPKGLELRLRPDLREIHLGEWEDHTFAWADKFDHDRMKLFGSSSPDFRGPGGESFGEIRDRGLKAIKEIAVRHPDQTVAVFAHGTIIKHILTGLEGLEVQDSVKMGHSDNTAVNLVEFDGDRGRVVFVNDNSHLSEEISTLAQQHWWRKDSKKKDINLWFQSADLDTQEHRDFYLACRQEAWVNLYGKLDEHYNGPAFLADAEAAWRRDPNALILAMKGDKAIGLLQLTPDHLAREGAGYIAFLYILPEERGSGLAIQLVGKAVSIYRAMGRDKLALAVSEQNTVAMNFYHKYGFFPQGTVPGAYGSLRQMEKPIGYENQGVYLL